MNIANEIARETGAPNRAPAHRIIAALGAALAAAMLLPTVGAGTAEAQTRFHIYIGPPAHYYGPYHGYYGPYHGPYYYGPYFRPYYYGPYHYRPYGPPYYIPPPRYTYPYPYPY